MTGFTQEYFTPFLLHLGAMTNHIGILNSAANFFSSIIQLFSAELTNSLKSRKKLISICILIQAASLLLLIFCIYKGLNLYSLFISLVVTFISFGALLMPSWQSLLADYVDVDKRGDYFGWRSRNMGFTTVAAMIGAGLILDHMKPINVAYGFMIIFSLAALCRLISLYFLLRMQEPPIAYSREHQFTIIQFFARIKSSNFAKFVVFVAMMNFSVNLAAPFFAVLMIRDLSFNYFLYTLITIVAPLMVYMSVYRWGRHADIVGNLKIIKMTSRLIAILPIFWMIYQAPWYLVLAEMVSGFVWAGFNLCCANFIYDAVTPPKRTRCIAYFNVVNGVALAAGALLGGFMVDKLPPVFGYQIFTLFVISSVLRIIVAFTLSNRLQEVRKIENINSLNIFFSMIRLRPIVGIDRQTIRNIG